MSSSQGGAFPIPNDTLPLPPKPNLEFERKRAKQILREVHDGGADLIARVRKYRDGIDSSEVKLSDVQLMIAREYGFASWPKLVAYFQAWNSHEKGPHYMNYQRDMCDFRVKQTIASHTRRQSHVCQTLAAFVPRFYGRTDAEIFDAKVTEQDARLAVARLERCPNWDALIEVADQDKAAFDPAIQLEPDINVRRERALGSEFAHALAAIDESDVMRLTNLVDASSELVHRERPRSGPGSMLLRHALGTEQKRPDTKSSAITNLLVTRGADLVATASGLLLKPGGVLAPEVEFLLDRGADPNWMTPSGLPILEWAVLRYWNREAVDVIARRAKPRSAFWIAAGLGDVPTMLKYLDGNGKPTDAARRDRPDFVRVDLPMPCRPDADDLAIMWEAFAVAGFNDRLNAIDALLDRGFPIDYNRWGSTLLKWAEGNQRTVLAEHLLRRGAK